ncbi:MAG: LutC/YkgG family protein [Actinomycetota bacterium]
MTEAFAAAAAANTCAVHGPLARSDVPAAVLDNERGHADGGHVADPDGDALLDELAVPARLTKAGLALVRPGDADWALRLADAAVGITSASVAVAATGTVAVVSGPGAPRATSLLPPVHVCLLRTGDIVAEFTDAIDRVGADALPSALIWVGGPSRTADLEMHQTLGVHGPKVVELVLVD